MSAAQELFEVLKDARPKDGPRHSAPVTKRPIATALKAVRFTVELPELGGAVELSPNRGFSPVHCKHCGVERENRREHWHDKKNNTHHVWWAPAPCNCRGTR
jgi:hypothetical protein